MKFIDRVKETTTTTGTEAFVLAGAVAGFQSFAGYSVGERVPYCLPFGAEWEVGVGTKTASTIERTTVTASSNGGALVNFSAGVKEVHTNASAAMLTEVDRNASARVYYLSKMGVASDADLTASSTTFGADSTAAVQAVLDLASATNPIKIMWDVKCSGTGWKIKSGTTIDALPGCGAILRTAANKSLFENANIRWTPATRIDKDIVIKGGNWNGNRGSSSGNNGKGTGTTGLNCIFRFYGVENLTFDPDLLICSPSYSSHVMNCKRVVSSRTKHDVGPSSVINNDGHNTGGYCEDVVYRDLTLNASDDPLSISPDDVWGQTGSFVYPFYPVTAMGPIKNVLVDNLNLQSIIYGVRLMSGTSRLDNVVIRNVTGYTTWWAILLDNYNAEGGLPSANGPGNIGNVTIDGVDVAVTGTAVIRIKSSVEKLTIRRLRRNSFGDAIPTILIDGQGVTIRSLEIDGYESDDTASTMVVPHIKMVRGTIKEMRIRNARVRRGGAMNGSTLLQVDAGAVIETLILDTISLDAIDNLVSNAGTINRIAATNIVHLNASGQSTFETTATIPRLVTSGYLGESITSGTFTQKSGDAFVAVADTIVPTATGAAVANATPTTVDVTMSESMDTAVVPAFSAFTVSGHTVSAGAWLSGTVFRLTVTAAFVNGEAARTVAYTQPGTANARDVAGNLLASFTGLSVTNNVQAAAGGANYATGATAVALTGDALLVDSGGIKSLTGAATSDAVYHPYSGAAGTSTLGSGTNGFVAFKFAGAAQGDQQIGFSTTSSAKANPDFGLVVHPALTSVIAIAGSGGTQTIATPPVAGNLYGIRVEGSVVTMVTSADMGATWTVMYTFVPTRSAPLYVNANLYGTGTIPYMQGVGLS